MMTDYTKPCFIDGKPVRILCTDRPGILTVVAMDEKGDFHNRRADGSGHFGDFPILNAPERVSRFYRVYGGISVGSTGWPTLAEARSYTETATAILEIEYDNGLPVSAKLHPVEEPRP